VLAAAAVLLGVTAEEPVEPVSVLTPAAAPPASVDNAPGDAALLEELATPAAALDDPVVLVLAAASALAGVDAAICGEVAALAAAAPVAIAAAAGLVLVWASDCAAVLVAAVPVEAWLAEAWLAEAWLELDCVLALCVELFDPGLLAAVGWLGRTVSVRAAGWLGRTVSVRAVVLGALLRGADAPLVFC
jgi:hypothetical protein